MQRAISICLVIVGLINFFPVFAVLSTEAIESAYAVALPGTDLGILMRHRALLFGIVGTFIIYSAFVPRYQLAAMMMAGASMFGYIYLLLQTGGYNANLHNVMIADAVGIAFLLIAVVLKYKHRHR